MAIDKRKTACIRVFLAILVLCSAVSCASSRAFRSGDESAEIGDWDAAVEHYRAALQKDPRNPDYRIALQRAMLNASRAHLERASAFEDEGALFDAAREYRLAADFDAANSYASDRARELDRRLRDQREASEPKAPIDEMRDLARREVEAPLLSPASREPLNLRFNDQSLRNILEFIGNATAVNVTYDSAFQDRRYSVDLEGVTIEEALDQILTANQYFYKIVNPKSIIVVPETPQKRAMYEEQVIRTFYISNADVQELATLLSQVVRVPQMAVQPQIVPNITSNTITVRATTAVASVIEQVIQANDKPRAEIVVDIEILEVNRDRAKEFGLDLTQYALGAVSAPNADRSTLSTSPNFASPPLARAGDFFFSLPSAVMNFLETDAETKLVAKPQLRGQEGTTLTLNLGDDIPVPATAFTPIAAGGATVNPLTSFNYRPVGVIVEMTPRVTFENEIILDLEVENSTLGPSVNVAGQSLPTFGTRRVITRLRLRDGESNLLAGLLREEDRRSLRGFPGLLRLPVLRQLLSANDNTIKQTDIIMLLTPRIVRTHELTQEDVSPIFIGTQRNIGLSGPPPLIDVDAGSRLAEGLLRPEVATGSVDSTVSVLPDHQVGGQFSQMSLIQIASPDHPLRAGAGSHSFPISIMGASDLTTLTLSLDYDPSRLRVRTVQEGSFMRQGGAEVVFAQQADTDEGRLDLALTRTDDVLGASGSGIIAGVLFEALESGETTLNLSGFGLTGSGSPASVEFGSTTLTVN
tara:strand:- start:20037 stop:22301 length:2265 start_codon:yes stop_codon:yes gene_type:complete